MRFSPFLLACFSCLAQNVVQPPSAGCAPDAHGSLRRLMGVPGAFIAGDSLGTASAWSCAGVSILFRDGHIEWDGRSQRPAAAALVGEAAIWLPSEREVTWFEEGAWLSVSERWNGRVVALSRRGGQLRLLVEREKSLWLLAVEGGSVRDETWIGPPASSAVIIGTWIVLTRGAEIELLNLGAEPRAREAFGSPALISPIKLAAAGPSLVHLSTPAGNFALSLSSAEPELFLLPGEAATGEAAPGASQ